jgi:flavin reductase (DIM6/NTAB) family NADH-FMN oxidoreductase RutF
MTELSDALREVMRGWPTGVAVVTSTANGVRRGLTVNSLASISLDPPMVVISLMNLSRTRALVMESQTFAVTLLDESQQHLADIFAGKVVEDGDRFAGLETFTLSSQAPLLQVGRAFLDCRVVHTYPMTNSTLFVGEVIAAKSDLSRPPLVYMNRGYHQVAK